jgi:HTH-type transcriptional regulator / antitoxin HigA
MHLKILKTKKEYHQALERFEEMFQAKPGSVESDEGDVLALLIKDYEDKHHVIDAPGRECKLNLCQGHVP